MNSIDALMIIPTKIKQLKVIDVPVEDRISLSVALIDISLEHYYSISILVERKRYGSAAALARPQMESYIVGLWLANEATDEEVSQFKSNGQLKSRTRRRSGNKKANKLFFEYIDELVSVSTNLQQAVKMNKDDVWAALNGYTHGGLIAVSRRFKDEHIKSNYDEKTVNNLAHFANQYAVFALSFLGSLEDAVPIRDDIDKITKLHCDAISAAT